MPSGVFPVPKFRPSPERANRPSLVRRIRTRLIRNRVDGRLAQGDPNRNPAP
jgi:hypothetical protein